MYTRATKNSTMHAAFSHQPGTKLHPRFGAEVLGNWSEVIFAPIEVFESVEKGELVGCRGLCKAQQETQSLNG